MKLYKLILALFFLFQYGIVVSQINDTINHYMFYPGSKYKIPEKREIIKYDKQNLTLVICYENWNKQTKQWRYVCKNKLTYNKNMLLENREDYFINYEKSEEKLRKVDYYEYDSEGNNTLILTKILEYDTVYINFSKTETLYENGKIREVKTFDWFRGMGNKHWELKEEKRYTYDSLGRIESHIEIRPRNSLYNKKKTYSYDENERFKEIVRSVWEDSLIEWSPLYNEKIFFNKSGNDSLLLMKKRNLSNNEWTLITKDSFCYNQMEKVIEKLSFVYNKEKANWEYFSKTKINYDNKGRLITEEYFDEWNKRINNYAVRGLIEYIIHSEAFMLKNFYVFPLSG